MRVASKNKLSKMSAESSRKFSGQSNYTKVLQELMQQIGISTFSQLSKNSGVSQEQLRRLRQGKVLQMRVEILLKLSETLQVSLPELITKFSEPITLVKPAETSSLIAIKQEYQRLEKQLANQEEELAQKWQQSSLQILESLLLQLPTAAYAAQKNPQLPAVKLLPLIIKPLEKLLAHWHVEAIATVGEELPYNPQWHQLMEGNAQPGDIVRVRYVGYRQGDKLLYRAKVSS